MVARQKPMTDAEIASAVRRMIETSTGGIRSTISDERREVLEYYRGEKPARAKRGRSTYVSMDVYASVSAMHDQLLETFSGNRQTIQFPPLNSDDVEPARIATEYCSYLVYSVNDGESVFSSVIHDGLTGRIGIAKVYWCEEEEIDEKAIEGAEDAQEAVAMVMDDGAEDQELDLEQDPKTGKVSGRVYVKKKYGYVKIEPVPPNEFGMSQRAKSLDDARMVWHRVVLTREELKSKWELKDKDIDDLSDEKDVWKADEEENDRFEDVEDGLLSDDDREVASERYWLYECYVKANWDQKGERRWKILQACGKMLAKEPVKDHPFVDFVPISVPHSAWGTNFAMLGVSTQKANTMLIRGILDHTAVTNNPRWEVVKGTLTDPNELLDNRFGGIVNVNRPESIKALEQQPLNPYVFQTLQFVDYKHEDRVGISRLSQGLNKDAISKQNSAALVEQLTDNGMVRQKIIARNFVKFLRKLYLKAYGIVIDHAEEEAGKVYEVAGNFVPVDPRAWRYRTQMTAEPYLGYGEADKEAEKWMMVDQLLSQNPKLGRLYTEKEAKALWDKVLRLRGVKNLDDYLSKAPPSPPPPSPEEQALQLEAQKAQQDGQIKQAEAQTAQMKVQEDVRLREMEMQLKARQQELDHQYKMADLAFKKQKMELDAEIARSEMAILKQKANSESLTAIASPNS